MPSDQARPRLDIILDTGVSSVFNPHSQTLAHCLVYAEAMDHLGVDVRIVIPPMLLAEHTYGAFYERLTDYNPEHGDKEGRHYAELLDAALHDDSKRRYIHRIDSSPTWDYFNRGMEKLIWRALFTSNDKNHEFAGYDEEEAAAATAAYKPSRLMRAAVNKIIRDRPIDLWKEFDGMSSSSREAFGKLLLDAGFPEEKLLHLYRHVMLHPCNRGADELCMDDDRFDPTQILRDWCYDDGKPCLAELKHYASRVFKQEHHSGYFNLKEHLGEFEAIFYMSETLGEDHAAIFVSSDNGAHALIGGMTGGVLASLWQPLMDQIAPDYAGEFSADQMVGLPVTSMHLNDLYYFFDAFAAEVGKDAVRPGFTYSERRALEQASEILSRPSTDLEFEGMQEYGLSRIPSFRDTARLFADNPELLRGNVSRNLDLTELQDFLAAARAAMEQRAAS